MSLEQIQNQIVNDHQYVSREEKSEKPKKEPPVKQPKPRKPREYKKLQELQNKLYYNEQYERRMAEAYSLHSGIVHKVREQLSEIEVLYEFLTKGMFYC